MTASLPTDHLDVALAAAFGRPQTLLDVGCGAGVKSMAARTSGTRVTGLEFDRALGERARRVLDEVFLVDPAPPSGEAQPAVVFPDEIYHLTGHPQSLFTYRLGGPTCLAGDVAGDFTFPRELMVGDILVFDDMAHYTMVKTTTFNGVKHPPIALQHADGRLEILREFSYADFRDRLA